MEIIDQGMKHYVTQTEHASRSLVGLISVEQLALSRAIVNLKKATAKFKVDYQVFTANEFHSAANYYYAQMVQAHKIKAEAGEAISEITAEIDAKSASISALSGALLQIAKQGISLIYTHPGSAPQGDDLSGISIKEIIWEGRNQTMHYENPKRISNHVVDLFERIDAVRNDGIVWDPKNKINYAFEIITFLGWFEWEQYKQHMCSISKL